MAVNKKLLKQLALGLGSTGLAGGIIGHHMGYKRGINKMTNAINNEFQNYNMQTSGGTYFDKQAEIAFKDELTKIAAKCK
jgi:hypothetical protein